MVGQEDGSTAMICDLFPADLVPHKGQGHAGEIASAAGAADDDIRIFPDFLELFLGFQSDDGLVQQDMVQNTAQGIFAVRGWRRHLPRLR